MPAPEPCLALLRAVNVGGRNAVPQRALAASLEAELGVPVRHHLQSGNLAVASADAASLGGVVASSIREQTGLEIAVIVRTLGQLEALHAANPWPDADPLLVHASIFDGAAPTAVQAVVSADWGGDEIVAVEGGAWMRFAESSRGSRLGTTLERRLGVVATARNARTVAALLDLVRTTSSETR
ncbi:DUF1697 domain-containing protein [Microcella daejeonensis]|uniref:DUF1697 domain-containing protein n=1 Tax=Microcella daejeonensis TaxID=2994971 RepID=A0A9E8S862_9MICO|nr:DUF1697 domain-containing protein [Microcella daejeonensis]WAB80614.1 DUF1697 domain-containing protein [Microcella daejeonensis]